MDPPTLTTELQYLERLPQRKMTRGVTGIAYEVKYGVDNWTSANTYDQAAAKLSPGDVMVIEQHQPGPDNGNYTAMEYWKANFDAL